MKVRAITVRIRSRSSAGELLGWALAGLGTGFLAGFVLGEVLGDVNRVRVRRAYDRWSGTELAPIRPLGRSASVRAAQAALNAEEALRELGLDVVGVGRGAVELHGWVPSRALRTRAARVVTAVPGIESLINGLLVRGEDDAHVPPGPDVTNQSA